MVHVAFIQGTFHLFSIRGLFWEAMSVAEDGLRKFYLPPAATSCPGGDLGAVQLTFAYIELNQQDQLLGVFHRRSRVTVPPLSRAGTSAL